MDGNIVGRFASGIYTFRGACTLWFASTLMALDESRSPGAMGQFMDAWFLPLRHLAKKAQCLVSDQTPKLLYMLDL